MYANYFKTCFSIEEIRTLLSNLEWLTSCAMTWVCNSLQQQMKNDWNGLILVPNLAISQNYHLREERKPKPFMRIPPYGKLALGAYFTAVSHSDYHVWQNSAQLATCVKKKQRKKEHPPTKKQDSNNKNVTQVSIEMHQLNYVRYY